MLLILTDNSLIYFLQEEIFEWIMHSKELLFHIWTDNLWFIPELKNEGEKERKKKKNPRINTNEDNSG